MSHQGSVPPSGDSLYDGGSESTYVGGRNLPNFRPRHRRGTAAHNSAARAKTDQPNDYNSIPFRPKSFRDEINLIGSFVILATLAMLSSIAVLGCAWAYKKKYDKENPAYISDDQTKLYKLSDMSWTLPAFTIIPVAGSAIFEYVSLTTVKVGYVEVIDMYRHIHILQLQRDPRAVDEAHAADEHLVNRATRRWMKKRYILYLLLAIAIIGVFAYLARTIWVHGTHPPVEKWQWRMMKVVRGKGKNKRVTRRREKVRHVTTPECTNKKVSFCQELKNLNYFIIAAIIIHAFWSLEILLIIYYLSRAAQWPELLSILAANVNYGARWQ